MPPPSPDGSSASARTSPAAPHPAPLESRGTGAHLWLLRHGEVASEWRGIAYGDLDVPLSEEGLARTRELARCMAALSPARVLSSPLCRARVLGRAIAEGAGVPLETDARLSEIHRGAWQGRRVDELHASQASQVDAFYADPWSWRDHGGEADQDVLARARGVLEDALDRPAGRGPIVVATHYNVIRVLTAAALGSAPARSFALRVDTGRAVLLVDGPHGFELHHANVLGPPLELTA